jgi:hypothetical protein
LLCEATHQLGEPPPNNNEITFLFTLARRTPAHRRASALVVAVGW